MYNDSNYFNSLYLFSLNSLGPKPTKGTQKNSKQEHCNAMPPTANGNITVDCLRVSIYCRDGFSPSILRELHSLHLCHWFSIHFIRMCLWLANSLPFPISQHTFYLIDLRTTHSPLNTPKTFVTIL